MGRRLKHSKHCASRRRLPMHRDWAALQLNRATRLRLDGLGKHRGLTWRQMPGGNDTIRAINFWLWRRGLIQDWKAESAASDALKHMADEEAAAAA